MGKVHIITSDNPEPNHEDNQKLVHRVITELTKIPGGQSLIDDATQKGDITINLTSNSVAGGAHWDAEKRLINISVPYPAILEGDYEGSNETSQELRESQLSLFLTIIFELCNAANPLLNDPTVNLSPLNSPSTEAYARSSEFREFKSFQRNAQLYQNAVAALDWPKNDGYVLYNDDEFDKYFADVADKEMSVYGDQKTHANYYREGFRRSFTAVRDSLVNILYLCSDSLISHLHLQEAELPATAWKKIDQLTKIASFKSLEQFDIEVEEFDALINLLNSPEFKRYRDALDNNTYNLEQILNLAKKRKEVLLEYQAVLQKLIMTIHPDLAKLLQVQGISDSLERALKEVDTISDLVQQQLKDTESYLKGIKALSSLYADKAFPARVKQIIHQGKLVKQLGKLVDQAGTEGGKMAAKPEEDPKSNKPIKKF